MGPVSLFELLSNAIIDNALTNECVCVPRKGHNLLTPGLKGQALIFHLNFEEKIHSAQSNLQ